VTFVLQVITIEIMEKTTKSSVPLSCPMVRAALLLGDEWILLALRALFRGKQRFDDLQKQTGAATNILTTRLNRMIEAGIVEKVPYQERPPRYHYCLTKAGLGLFPVLMELMRYGEQWLPSEEAPPFRLRHLECGHLTKPGQSCSECGEPILLGNVRLEEQQCGEPE
jgi:DNA-binding HxlR family transcriptional regulator